MKIFKLASVMAPLFFLISFSQRSMALEFKFKGNPIKSIEHSKLTKNKKAAPVTILEPHLDQVITYTGIPFNQLMDDSIGKKWRSGEEILFTCADGYQPSIPVAKFKKYKAWLVWSRKDGQPFEIINTLQANEKVALGPLYLVWENQNESELLEGGATDFPYQVVGVDVISFKDKFPKLAPPENSSASVMDGFLLYRKYCMTCHAIDGEGGQKAPDLKLTNVMGRLSESDLKRWLLTPDKVKPGTLMPPFAPKLPNRETAVQPLIDYLKAVLNPSVQNNKSSR